MDALARLALMTKAKLLFETSDTFLSFPALTPISYAPALMNFINPTTPEQMHTFAEFSTWTNTLPQGTIFQPSLTNLLWDVYQGVLNSAQVAQGSLTAAQTAALQAAQAVLSTPDANGVLVDTPALVAYKQYQQAYLAANQGYNNQQITASASADPTVTAAWQNGGQATAQASLTAAESDWETKGFRVQVEAAQLTVQTLSSQSPQLKWTSWQNLCIPETDFPPDPTTESTFGPTVFAPYDVINQPSWPFFSIAGADIPNLVSQAPPELKSIFGTTSGDSTIDSISFEYCSVGLSRPWFRPDVFAARFWRFSDPAVQLSDGNNPASGEWPAYITSVVFARNIVIQTHAAGPVPPPAPAHTFNPLPPTGVHAAPVPAPHPLPGLLLSPAALRAREFPGSNPAAPLSGAVHAVSATHAGQVLARVAGPAIQGHSVAVAEQPVAARPLMLNPILRMRLSAATFPSSSARRLPPRPSRPPRRPAISLCWRSSANGCLSVPIRIRHLAGARKKEYLV